MSRSTYISKLSLRDIITFGKHSGKSVKEVITQDPMWLDWAIQNIKSFSISDYAKEQVRIAVNEYNDMCIEYVLQRDEWMWK